MKQLEINFIRSELVDTLTPSVAMTEITSIVCDMMEGNIDYVKKNGLTEPAKISRERLLKLLNITELFNLISCSNNELKLYNRHLYKQNLILQAELNEIKRQENLSNAI